MPGVIVTTRNVATRNNKDWLLWGKGTDGKNKLLKVGFSVTISGDIGTYFGEWETLDKEPVPFGCGLLYC